MKETQLSLVLNPLDSCDILSIRKMYGLKSTIYGATLCVASRSTISGGDGKNKCKI